MNKGTQAVAVAVIAAAALAVGGCTYEPNADRHADETSPALVIAMPEGFSNIATKCVGDLRYSTIYTSVGYGALSVVYDRACQTEQTGPSPG